MLCTRDFSAGCKPGEHNKSLLLRELAQQSAFFDTGMGEFCVIGVGNFSVIVTKCVDFDGLDSLCSPYQARRNKIVEAITEARVDFVGSGALTHSVKAVDLTMEFT